MDKNASNMAQKETEEEPFQRRAAALRLLFYTNKITFFFFLFSSFDGLGRCHMSVEWCPLRDARCKNIPVRKFE